MTKAGVRKTAGIWAELSEQETQTALCNFAQIEKGSKNLFFKTLLYWVIPIGFEPMTYCLEGSCSIQLSYGTSINVGVAGFEPTTSCSQSRRDTGLRYTPKRSAKVVFFCIYHTKRPEIKNIPGMPCC